MGQQSEISKDDIEYNHYCDIFCPSFKCTVTDTLLSVLLNIIQCKIMLTAKIIGAKMYLVDQHTHPMKKGFHLKMLVRLDYTAVLL